MKKQDVAGLVLYLIIFAIAIIFGLTVLRTHAVQSSIKGWMYVLYLLGAVLSGLVIGALITELGHILGAKIGKYNILSVNVLFLCFYKKEKGWGFKFAKFNGLTGETVITPKNKKESSPKAYLSLGNMVMVLLIIVGVILFILINGMAINDKSLYDVAYFILTASVTIALILIYNIAPVELDTLNDGYRLRLISNIKNKEALNELLEVEYQFSLGKKDIEIQTFTEITAFTASLNLNKVYVYLNNHENKKAEEILDIILAGEDSLPSHIYLHTKSLKIALVALSNSYEDAYKYYEDKVGPQENRILSEEKSSLSCIRAYLLTAGLFDKSKSECEYSLAYAESAFKKVPKQRKDIEKELFNLALNKVLEAHPNWNLSDYKLN